MAEAYDVAVALHCPLGPIALASCLQLDVCTPNAVIQEQSHGIHYNQGGDLLDSLVEPTIFKYSEEYAQIPQGLGLGNEINEEKVREADSRDHNLKTHYGETMTARLRNGDCFITKTVPSFHPALRGVYPGAPALRQKVFLQSGNHTESCLRYLPHP